MPTMKYQNSKGERLSGVTTIINSNLGWSKQQLMWWSWQQGKAGKDYKETVKIDAAAGTLTHALIEADIKGLPSIDTKEMDKECVAKAETAYLNFLEWKAMVKFEVVATEPHLVSEVHQFGGTPDCLAKVNGKLVLFDWKSGGGVYEDMLIQLSAYKVLWEENYPSQPLTGFHLLRIDKETANFVHHYWGDLSRAWDVFLNLLAIHTAHKILKKLAK